MPDPTRVNGAEVNVLEHPFEKIRKDYLGKYDLEKGKLVRASDGKAFGEITDAEGNPPMALKVGGGDLWSLAKEAVKGAARPVDGCEVRGLLARGERGSEREEKER